MANNEDEFYFDYRKYNSVLLEPSKIDNLLDTLTGFKIPKVPIPYVGAYLELAMLLMQIAGIFKLLSMKKEAIDVELEVARQIHAQDLRRRRDDEVIN